MQAVTVNAQYCLCSFSFSFPCCICLYCSVSRGQEGSAFIHFLALCIMEHHTTGRFSLDCKNITIVLVEVLFKVSCIKEIWDSGNVKLRAVAVYKWRTAFLLIIVLLGFTKTSWIVAGLGQRKLRIYVVPDFCAMKALCSRCDEM